MSSLSKSLAILDVFTPRKMMWTAEEICDELSLSRPTGYRYLRGLSQAGLLAKLGPGTYSLGPRIVEWDYLIRQADPMLSAALPAIRNLASETGLDVNLVGLYGDQILTTHEECGSEKLPLSFGRGRPFPLMRGAVSRTVIAHFPPARLKRIYESHKREAHAMAYGSTWDEFRKGCAEVKRQGYSISRGELDPGMSGVAVPVFGNAGRIIGCVVAAMLSERIALTRIDVLVGMLRAIAASIEHKLTAAPQLEPFAADLKAAG